jgi:hypothetical protein
LIEDQKKSEHKIFWLFLGPIFIKKDPKNPRQ